MTQSDHPGDGPATSTPFTISDPATIIQRGFAAKVSAEDLQQAFDAIHALRPEHHTDPAARILCLIKLFGEPGGHEVSARVAAIDWRCLALARLHHRPVFKYWSSRSDDGVLTIGPILLEAAANEPLIETDGEPGFDAEKFFKRLRLH